MPLCLVHRLVPWRTPRFGKVKNSKGFGDLPPWDKNSPPPELPADIVARTREKYLEAYERLTGRPLPSI
jgi:hypothetical protein